MVGHGGSSAGSYLADPTSPIPFHCASVVATSTVRVKAGQTENAHSQVVDGQYKSVFTLFTIGCSGVSGAQWIGILEYELITLSLP